MHLRLGSHVVHDPPFPTFSARARRVRDGFSFCTFAFVLSVARKVEVMQLENRFVQSQERQSGMFAAMLHGAQALYLPLAIHRDAVVRDAITQLSEIQLMEPDRLKKRLRVSFVGEDGLDEGGVQKEFFQIVIRDLFDPKYGMFVNDEESRCFWFSAHTLEVCPSRGS